MTRQSLLEIATRLQQERAAARPEIARLREGLELAWDEPLPDAWRTLGFVDELTSLAATIMETNPRESKALAQFAVAVATAIPRDAYPAVTLAQVEGRAWKELGTAHRYLSDYAAATRAYDAAQRAFATSGALGHDVAKIDLAKAVVSCEAGQHEEALALVEHCRPLLESFGDEKRLVHAAMIGAMVKHRSGDLRGARSAYEDALAVARQSEDLHTTAALYANLAHVCIELNDTNAASVAVSQARELFRDLGMPLEVSRAEFALARLLMHNAEYREAIPLLRRLRNEFLMAGMVDEAGVAALDIVDALVAIDQRDAAIHLVNVVLAEYRAAGIERALVALAYLRDLLRDHPAPTRAIRHVREYVSDTRTSPARVFAPLPE